MLQSSSTHSPLSNPDTGRPIPGFHESATVTYNGRSFTATGAVVSPTYAYGYLRFPIDPTTKKPIESPGTLGTLHAWNGDQIGTARITSSWRTPRSFVSSHLHQVIVTINGARYTGRSAGHGMLWRGRPTSTR